MKYHEKEITSKYTNKEEKKTKDETTDIPYPIDQWEEHNGNPTIEERRRPLKRVLCREDSEKENWLRRRRKKKSIWRIFCHDKKRIKMKNIYTCCLSTTLTNKDLQKRRRNPEESV